MNMKKVLAVYTAILLISLSSFFVGFNLHKVQAGNDLDQNLDVFLEVLNLIKNNYVNKNVDNKKLVYGAINGMIGSLDDPYTRFLKPKPYKEMKIRMKGSYAGIGIYIGIKEKQLMVISPIEGTPAKKVGLKSKDKIMAIDKKSTKDMALDEAVSLIRGKEGTSVVLTIKREGVKKDKDYAIKRAKIAIHPVSKKMIGSNIGYIQLKSFEQQTAPQEIVQAIDTLKKNGAKGIIIDLRNNGGGLLQNAIEIGGMFIKKGTIVYTVDRNGNKEIMSVGEDSGPTRFISGLKKDLYKWPGPLVVIVNGSSASASEILAGAIQDNKRGTIVGTHTFGKASVQNIHNLTDGSAVLVTIAKYYTPLGRDITKKGIQPDVLIEIPTQEVTAKDKKEVKKKDIEGIDAEDLQLIKAIEIIKKKIKG